MYIACQTVFVWLIERECEQQGFVIYSHQNLPELYPDISSCPNIVKADLPYLLLDKVGSSILQNIPTLYEQSKNLCNTREVNHTPDIGQSGAGVVDINEVVHDPAQQVSTR